jgi:hypothetical protein
MHQTFSVDAPIIDGNLIQTEHIQAKHKALGYLTVAILAAMASIVLSWYLGNVEPLAAHHRLAAIGLASSAAVFAAVAAFLAASHADHAARCTPLEPDQCAQALSMTKLHPELELYRKTVVATRTFVAGDLQAMSRFIRAKREREAWASLHSLN